MKIGIFVDAIAASDLDDQVKYVLINRLIQPVTDKELEAADEAIRVMSILRNDE